MKRSTDRILCTHVGSLIRPPELVACLRAIDNGEYHDQRTYSDCLAASVADIVREQSEAGIDIVSDGEFGKSASWSRYAQRRATGRRSSSFEPTEVRGGAHLAALPRGLATHRPEVACAAAPDRLPSQGCPCVGVGVGSVDGGGEQKSPNGLPHGGLVGGGASGQSWVGAKMPPHDLPNG